MTKTSFRAFARAIGVAHSVVSKAARGGRLKHSLGYDEEGRVYIADAALARREFKENASKPQPERQRQTSRHPRARRERTCGGDPFGGVDAEALVFDVIEFVLVNHVPKAILSTEGGRVDQFDPQALHAWLRRRDA